ncbi:hypothetical protein NDU88_007264 [Pleurodeles waltl]|uniref:Uncharacterized protein n=1 Tax=Pleurodeles waltl TaxID=8319 RepID=A0AAV7N5V6_PLEWA|nr:hypothetical protein NDU88_007264 [Pleurodeles waltl]
MVAPSEFIQDTVLIDLEGEGDEQIAHVSEGSGSKDAGPGIAGRPSTSQGAGLLLEHGEEEFLDYEEEEEVHEVAVQTGAPVERPQASKRAVQGDRLVGRHQELVAGNLLRGEDFGYEPMRAGAVTWGCGMQD